MLAYFGTSDVSVNDEEKTFFAHLVPLWRVNCFISIVTEKPHHEVSLKVLYNYIQ